MVTLDLDSVTPLVLLVFEIGLPGMIRVRVRVRQGCKESSYWAQTRFEGCCCKRSTRDGQTCAGRMVSDIIKPRLTAATELSRCSSSKSMCKVPELTCVNLQRRQHILSSKQSQSERVWRVK